MRSAENASYMHCDIRPENILLDADYNPLLSDFGLAKLLGRDFSRVFDYNERNQRAPCA